jgi:hypothetical protein
MNLSRTFRLGATLLLAAFFGAFTANAQSLSGDDILARAAEVGPFNQLGGRVDTIDFSIVNDDGTVAERTFAFLGKREVAQDDKLLIYFLEPELERGTIFLSLDPNEPAEETKLWLFLSAFGQTKELVSEQDRDAGFGGSDLQNDQIGGGFDFGDDYSGEFLAEEAITATWLGQEQARPAFKVALTRLPGSDVDFPEGTAWFDSETFLLLKAEFTNDLGKLEQRFAADDVVSFEGNVEPNVVVVENVLEGSQTTISISERSRLDLSDELFDPQNLPVFDPGLFGIEG